MMTLLALLLLLIAGVIYEAIAARTDRARYPPPGKLVDAGGVALHLNCTGCGTPIVVLDAGLGDSSLVWLQVQEQVSLHTRVCSYDRAGLAWSEPGPAPRSSERTVAELHTLLLNAGEQSPYILVGHSAGVNYVRLFAHTYPDVVAGLVLIEPPILTQASPFLVTALTILRQAIGVLARAGGVRLLGKLSLLRLLFGGVSPPPALAERAGLLYSPQSIQASIQETQALPETIWRVNLFGVLTLSISSIPRSL